MKSFRFSFGVYLAMAGFPAQADSGDSPSVNLPELSPKKDMPNWTTVVPVSGMNLSYRRLGQRIQFAVSAPTTGWLALGFNRTNSIVGADLKMAAVVHGNLRFEDQFVTGMGVHPPKSNLNAVSNTKVVTYSQEASPPRTKIVFEMPASSTGPYNFDHSPGRKAWIILAYSTSPDFGHHSLVRRHIQLSY